MEKYITKDNTQTISMIKEFQNGYCSQNEIPKIFQKIKSGTKKVIVDFQDFKKMDIYQAQEYYYQKILTSLTVFEEINMNEEVEENVISAKQMFSDCFVHPQKNLNNLYEYLYEINKEKKDYRLFKGIRSLIGLLSRENIIMNEETIDGVKKYSLVGESSCMIYCSLDCSENQDCESTALILQELLNNEISDYEFSSYFEVDD